MLRSRPFALALFAAVGWSGVAAAADLSAIDRTIQKEPAYQSKAPTYCLLVFGPEAQHRVWLVVDGDTLYVDRNGNGDLTEPGEKVPSRKDKNSDPDGERYTFDAGDLRTGERLHKNLTVNATNLSLFSSSVTNRSNAQEALKKDPKAKGFLVAVEIDRPGLKGSGVGGRLLEQAGILDLGGVLQFADTPKEAPVIHFDGPWQVTFYGERPKLRLGREEDFVLVVGTPGRGAGTFAMLDYEDTIPEKALPKAEITLTAKEPGRPPPKELHELKERC
jgi:hypothetical protein